MKCSINTIAVCIALRQTPHYGYEENDIDIYFLYGKYKKLLQTQQPNTVNLILIQNSEPPTELKSQLVSKLVSIMP